MNAKDLHPLIHPAIHAKFSPNLHAWVKRQTSEGLPLVATKPNERMGSIYVGQLDSDGWLIGSQLMGVLSKGAKEKIWAFHPKPQRFEFDASFWQRYQLDGRCAIDPEHRLHFVGDETRWKTNGKIRECQWCGHHVQTKLEWSEIQHKSEWVPA